MWVRSLCQSRRLVLVGTAILASSLAIGIAFWWIPWRRSAKGAAAEVVFTKLLSDGRSVIVMRREISPPRVGLIERHVDRVAAPGVSHRTPERAFRYSVDIDPPPLAERPGLWWTDVFDYGAVGNLREPKIRVLDVAASSSELVLLWKRDQWVFCDLISLRGQPQRAGELPRILLSQRLAGELPMLVSDVSVGSFVGSLDHGAFAVVLTDRNSMTRRFALTRDGDAVKWLPDVAQSDGTHSNGGKKRATQPADLPNR